MGCRMLLIAAPAALAMIHFAAGVQAQDVREFSFGYDQPKSSTGDRRPLFDKSRQNVVTFVADVPTRASKKVLPSGSTQVTIDDTAYAPNSTYTVAVPGQPSTNVLENLSGDPLDLRTQVTSVFIKGRLVPDDDRHNRLYLKYKARPLPVVTP